MGKRIVIIDNDERICELFARPVQEKGWQISNYSYANYDLATVEQDNPDLIIIDFSLRDGGGGWEILQLLKMENETAKIPILITTALFQLSASVQDYLVTRFITVARKSLDSETFIALVHKTLEQASQSTSLFLGDRTLPILLVDDTEDIREDITTVLRMEGYRVVTADNGLVALDRVSRADYCLILLDIDMPVMNGFEFLSAYERQLRPHSPVIIVSGHQDVRFNSLPIFVVDTLPKPFSIDPLLAAVGKYAQPA